MSQQAGIVVLIDVDAAVESQSLTDNAYLVDNTGSPGDPTEGTAALITEVEGSHWSDGSQAEEQVLNWVLYALGSLPPTLPRNYRTDQVRKHERAALRAPAVPPVPAGPVAATLTGDYARVRRRGSGATGRPLLDVRGQLLADVPDWSHVAHSRATPILIDITGEAVEKNILYPALYGSPDRTTEGWYWSASVDTSRPGTYAYTLVVEIRELAHTEAGWHWTPHRMTVEAFVRITSKPCVNGFTGLGVDVLPLPLS